MSHRCEICDKTLKTKQSLDTHFKSAAHKKKESEQPSSEVQSTNQENNTRQGESPVLCQFIGSNNNNMDDEDDDDDYEPSNEPSLLEQNQNLIYIIERKDAQIQYLTKLIAHVIVDRGVGMSILNEATDEEELPSNNNNQKSEKSPKPEKSEKSPKPEKSEKSPKSEKSEKKSQKS